MIHESISSRFEPEQAVPLWIRGCLILSVFGLFVLAIVSGRLYGRHQHSLLDTKPERINPNTASMGSLVRLDGIGRARAMDIIHFRQTHNKDGTAFQSAHDMQQIRGIGPKTVEKLSPWLVFASERSQ